MTRHLLMGLLCAAIAGACGGARSGSADGDDQGPEGNGSPDAGPRLNPPGTHSHSLTVGALTREVIVYVPALAEETRAPAVFMFHGTSGTGQLFYDISGWKEKADTEGMIVLFPSALTHCYHEDENDDGDFTDPGERKVLTKWAAGKLGEPDGMPLCTADEVAALSAGQQALADHPLADDMAFFDAMLGLLAGSYVVDDRAIHVTGFSNGAQMSSRLAVERSDRVAAGHASGGTLSVDGVASRPLSMIFSVGALDDRFTTLAGVEELPLTEAELNALPVFRGIVGAYLAALQLSEAYSYELITIGGGKQAARFLFSTSLVGAGNTFEAVVLEDLPHQYPNGANYPLSAPNQVWAFFETQRLP
ncbi:MAG: hypothetical protein AB2A00_08330 [Myxococcota bacterium]